MKILHVVTALSPDNRFGGPARVALDLAAAAQDAGHEVLVLAAGVAWRRRPTELAGVRVRVLRGWMPIRRLGWAGLIAPGLSRESRRLAADADVVHIHLARDLVTLTAGFGTRRATTPYVVQTHGMIDSTERRLGRLVDRTATGKVVRGAAAALVLTDAERKQLVRLGMPGTRIVSFPNGVTDAPSPRHPAESGAVLFLARLHPRKGAAEFCRAAVRVAPKYPDIRFSIVGPDEGDASSVDAIRATAAREIRERIDRTGAVGPDEARLRLAECLLYVLPAAAEPFGMTVVEAMAAGRPVAVSADAELAPRIRYGGAGWTFGPGGEFADLESLLTFVLADREEIERAGTRASLLVDKRFRLRPLSDELLRRYNQILDH